VALTREGVGYDHSSVESRDSITLQERRVVTCAGSAKNKKGLVTAEGLSAPNEKLREFSADYADERRKRSSEDCSRKAV
jgi:hypothetical protein